MWLSRQIIKQVQEPTVQKGRVTLNSQGELEAVSTGVERSVKVFSPYGYSYSLPEGEDMILTQSNGEQSSFGVEMDLNGVKTGEIKITSYSGGYIYLKNDGSVIINGLKISKTGVIENGK